LSFHPLIVILSEAKVRAPSFWPTARISVVALVTPQHCHSPREIVILSEAKDLLVL
jgi:hypothetical protein